MAKYSNIKLTQKGLDMAINADKSKKLIYTHIGIGDGRLVDSEDVLNLTEMKSRKIFADISDINNDSKNQVTLETIVSNKVVTQGFYAREIGIYAKLGESGTEVLYAYANAGDEADYMPDKTQPIDELKLKITLIVGNVDNVAAIVNSSIIFITLADCRREIQRHNVDPLAHGDFARKKDYYTKPEVDSKLNTKANRDHGLHVPSIEQANNTRFLRNDNTWQTITPYNIGSYHKNETYNKNEVNNITDQKMNTRVSKSGDTMTGNLTVPSIYANNWFRARGNCGFSFEDHGGGWHMTDNEWIRAFNGKNIYTTGRVKADNGFFGNLQGKATSAGRADSSVVSDRAVRVENDHKNMRFHWAGQGGQPTWLWGGNDGGNMYVYNPSNFNVNHAKTAGRADSAVRADTAGTADNANRLQGKDVNHFYRHLGGRETPTLTPLVDWERMKQENGGQDVRNLRNPVTGIVAYGGDTNFRGKYPNGTILLKQSYKNFDKILVFGTNDECNFSLTALWDRWQLEFMFNNSYRFIISDTRGIYWEVVCNKRGSSETLWLGSDQNSGLIEIYGVNY